jgi:hypothetical protein
MIRICPHPEARLESAVCAVARHSGRRPRLLAITGFSGFTAISVIQGERLSLAEVHRTNPNRRSVALWV